MTDFETEGERLAEQFKTLRENQMVLDWWQKQLTRIRYGYQGVSHALNVAMADLQKVRKQLLEENQALKDRCEQLELERDQAFAAIGELQAGLAATDERVQRMAEWAKTQKGAGK